MKKLISLILALVMVMGLAVGASAATVSKSQVDGDGGTKVDKFTGPASITVTLPTATNAESVNNTYSIYKVFDATTDANGTNISYTLVEGKTTAPSGFAVDAAGNVHFGTRNEDGTVTKNEADELPTDSINAIKTYVTDNDLVATVVTTKDDTSFTVANLPYGYYYITTTSGSLVTVDSTKPNAQVSDKNEYPTLTKEVDKETAYKGETLTFTLKVKIPKSAVGAIVVHDTMTNVDYLSMTAVDGIGVADGTDGCTKEFTLSADYVATNKGNEITITYTGTFMADDIATNKAYLAVGNTFTSKEVEVETLTTDIVIEKVISGSTTPLKDAKFVLKNEAGKFYAVDGNGVVSWKDNQTDAGVTVVTTNDDGYAEFSNVADGTYYLVETEAPAGYNLLTAPVRVDVTAGKDTVETEGTEKTVVVDITAKVENSSGSELPSTGGIGTTLFYVIGSLMMAGAAVLLITKKRMA